MYDQLYKKFMRLTKADIIARGQAEGIWSTWERNTQELMKWNKSLLAGILAGRLERRELRGY